MNATKLIERATIRYMDDKELMPVCVARSKVVCLPQGRSLVVLRDLGNQFLAYYKVDRLGRMRRGKHYDAAIED